MAKPPSSARRTNRALAAMAVVVFLLSGGTAWAQIVRDEVVEIPEQEVTVTAPTNTSGQRPAETSLSWFNHGFGTEQIDYDMDSLSCRNVAESITPDICAVARTKYGEFMVVGTEGFWDSSEFDNEGRTWVPLNLAVFVMRDDIKGPRAISVLDGITEKAYTELAVIVDLYTARINGDDVIVLHKHLADSEEDPYSLVDSVQVLAMSSTGAPTVTATYEGHQLHVASSGRSLELSSLRYRSSTTTPNPQWFTRVSLFPASVNSTTFNWNEIVTSNDQRIPNGAGMTLESSYEFPSTRTLTSNSSSQIT